jgi:Novel STAND NTPase 1
MSEVQPSPPGPVGAGGGVAPETSANKPYKGPESFEIEDAQLFFGRDGEARELTARILSSRITVLYAASGAGKTSLLNARIIPTLEARGWAPIRVRIDNDPIEAVRLTTLQYLFPPPASELEVLAAARAALSLTGAEATLRDLVVAYDDLNVGDERRRRLVSPVATAGPPHPSLFLKPFGRVTPYFARLLRASIDIEMLEQHFRAQVTFGAAADTVLWPMAGLDTRLDDVAAGLRHPGFVACYQRALAVVYPPVPDLQRFFRNLFETYGALRRDFLLVLILDQFEELFTRFIDYGVLLKRPANAANWRLREMFIAELESLYPQERTSPVDATFAAASMRFVVALREEYLGRLDWLRAFAPELNDSTYRLGFLPSREAEKAILEPARHYSYTYDPDCLGEIVTALSREGTVEPFLLQIVCDRLWRKIGGALSHNLDASLREMRLDQLRDPAIGGVQGIIDSYFGEILSELGSDAARADAFEMIELLITRESTRNIVEDRVLIESPFKSAARRRAVLDTLVAAKFLRRERRLGSLFVELTHECLIDSAKAKIQEHSIRSRELRAALRTFEGIEKGDPPVLDADDFRTLDASAEQIEWPTWAVVLMYQSAACHAADPGRFRYWHARYVESARSETPPVLETLLRGERYLTLAELRRIERAREDQSLPINLSRRQQERIMRSLLFAATLHDQAALAYWARRIEAI